MKKYIFIPENLLLLLLLLLPFSSFLLFPFNLLLTHLQNKFGLLSILNRIYWIVIIGTCIAYIFHFILRKTKRWQKIFCNIHIWLTIIIIAIIIKDYYWQIPIITYKPIPVVYSQISSSVNIFLQIFILLQALFIGYSSFRLIQTKKVNNV